MKLTALTQSTFKEHIAKNPLVLVKFTAPWCGPCKTAQPILEKAADEFPGVSFVEVDVDQQPLLAAQFNIRSIPTIMAWKDGQVAWTALGVPKPQQLKDELHQLSK